MADTFSVQQRFSLMGRIRSRGKQATELEFVRLVVLIAGDYRHGSPRKFRLPKSNPSHWTEIGNRRSDRRVNRLLQADAWHVVRFRQSSLVSEVRTVRRVRLGIQDVKAKRKCPLARIAPRSRGRRPSIVRKRQVDQ